MVKGMKLVFDRPVGLTVQRVKRNPFIRTPWSPYAFINSIDDRNSLQSHDLMMVFVFPHPISKRFIFGFPIPEFIRFHPFYQPLIFQMLHRYIDG